MLACTHRSPTKIPAVFEGIGAFPSSMKNKLMNAPRSSHNKHRIKKKKDSIGLKKGISLFVCANGKARQYASRRTVGIT